MFRNNEIYTFSMLKRMVNYILHLRLKSKLVKKITNNLIIHSFKEFECEICKMAIPGNIK